MRICMDVVVPVEIRTFCDIYSAQWLLAVVVAYYVHESLFQKSYEFIIILAIIRFRIKSSNLVKKILDNIE